MIWLLILRGFSLLIEDTMDYNQYMGVASSFPWLVAFFLFTHRSHVSLPLSLLLFMSLVVYCGDNTRPDASPLRAILAGSLGVFISISVALAFRSLETSSLGKGPLLTDLWDYFDSLIDESHLAGTSDFLERKREKCFQSISVLSGCSAVTLMIMECFESLQGLEVMVRSHVSKENLIPFELKSRYISEAADLERSARSIMTSKEGNYKEMIYRFFLAVEKLRLYEPETLRFSQKVKWYVSPVNFFKGSWKISRVELLESVRFSLVLVGLCELLIFWDANDTSVDTYAIWGFLPALMLLDREVTCMGQGILDGARYFFFAFLGSLLGLITLLMNSGAQYACISQVILVVGSGMYLQKSRFRNKVGDCGLVLIIAWMQCVLGNFGKDPFIDANDNGMNSLWRVALYRMAIVSFSTFVVALSFVCAPSSFAYDRLNRDIAEFTSGCASLLTRDDKSDCENFTKLVRFSLFELEQRIDWVIAEGRNPGNRISQKNLIDLLCATLAARSCSAVSIEGEEAQELAGVADLKKSIAKFQDLQQGKSIKPRARELLFNLALFKRDCPVYDNQSAVVVCQAISLIEFSKKMIPFEAFFGLDDVESGRDCTV